MLYRGVCGEATGRGCGLPGRPGRSLCLGRGLGASAGGGGWPCGTGRLARV